MTQKQKGQANMRTVRYALLLNLEQPSGTCRSTIGAMEPTACILLEFKPATGFLKAFVQNQLNKR